MLCRAFFALVPEASASVFAEKSESFIFSAYPAGLAFFQYGFHVSVVLSDYPVAVSVYGSGLLSCCEFLEVLGCYVFEVPAHDVAES